MKAIGASWDCVAGWDGTGCATGHSSVKKSVSASCMRRIVNPGGRIYAFRVYANGLMKCGLGPFDLSTSWRLMPVVAGRTILSEVLSLHPIFRPRRLDRLPLHVCRDVRAAALA